MVCHLSLGPSHLAALMAAHRMSAARSQAQFDALRRCDGLIRLDRLVSLTLPGDEHRSTTRRGWPTCPDRRPDP